MLGRCLAVDRKTWLILPIPSRKLQIYRNMRRFSHDESPCLPNGPIYTLPDQGQRVTAPPPRINYLNVPSPLETGPLEGGPVASHVKLSQCARRTIDQEPATAWVD